MRMPIDLRERLEHLVRQELKRRGLSRMYPTVMLREDRICFRLSDPKTKGISKWSEWLTKDELEHPEAVVEQMEKLLVDLGYDPDIVEVDTSSSSEEAPSFDDLMEILLRLPLRVPCESMQLVLVSRATGIAQFVDVDDNPSLRSNVQQALESLSIPLCVSAFLPLATPSS
jgi:hypothetical protein